MVNMVNNKDEQDNEYYKEDRSFKRYDIDSPHRLMGSKKSSIEMSFLSFWQALGLVKRKAGIL